MEICITDLESMTLQCMWTIFVLVDGRIDKLEIMISLEETLNELEQQFGSLPDVTV